MVAMLLGCWVTDGEVKVRESVPDSSVPDSEGLPDAEDLPVDWSEVVEDSMELIPAGIFMMGCTPGDLNCQDDEAIHQVELTNYFHIMRIEVTQEMFEGVMGYQPSYFAGCPDCPVEQVTWHEAALFANKLSAAEGLSSCYTCYYNSAQSINCWGVENIYTCQGYRLPTEAEWEYAARCEDDSLYAGSDDIDEVAWYVENSGGETHPGEKKEPNACGLYDMSGNVWEWVQDWYDNYPEDTTIDYMNGGGDGNYRVIRGGSYGNSSSITRIANRFWSVPDARYSRIGFRLVRWQCSTDN